MQELVETFSGLLREHAELQSDYLSERDNRRNYQNRVEEAHRSVSEHERQLVRIQVNPFVVLLFFRFLRVFDLYHGTGSLIVSSGRLTVALRIAVAFADS